MKEKHYAVTLNGVLCRIQPKDKSNEWNNDYLCRPLFEGEHLFYQLKGYLRPSRVAYTVTIKSWKK